MRYSNSVALIYLEGLQNLAQVRHIFQTKLIRLVVFPRGLPHVFWGMTPSANDQIGFISIIRVS